MRIRTVVVPLALATALQISACGGDDSTSSTPSAGTGAAVPTPVQNEGPSAEEVATWPEKWCTVQPGVTKQELLTVMGPPTEDGAEGSSWDAFGYQFNAFYDETGKVRQLDINTIMLSSDQQAKIAAAGCDETRVQ